MERDIISYEMFVFREMVFELLWKFIYSNNSKYVYSGNTKIKPITKDYTRLSIVAYLRDKMINCKGKKLQ